MKRLWIFRSNLKILEYYHKYKDFESFEKQCHDFYLMMGIEYLKSGDFDEVTIWRLHPYKKQSSYTIDVNGKRFIQRWVDNFKQCMEYMNVSYGQPDVSFFRGGFPEYCQLTKTYSKELGNKIYLGAGKRVTPQFGGIYNKVLVECEKDLSNNTYPFYKTCNPFIFRPLDMDRIYDICFIANFSQTRYKGQEYIIQEISKSKLLQTLKFIFVGNKPDIGIKLANKYKVNNIEFKGWVNRLDVNKILNQSKVGIVASNINDGCPRISTEILCSGTPLLIRESTRLLQYYKQFGVIEFSDKKFETRIMNAIYIYNTLYKELRNNLNRFSYKKICEKNINIWNQ